MFKVLAATCGVLLAFTISTPIAGAAVKPTVSWKMSSLSPNKSYGTYSIATTNSSGTKVWSVSGSCTLIAGKVTTLSSGSCVVNLQIRAKDKFAALSTSKKLFIKSSAASIPSNSVSTSQANAKRSATSYLGVSAFSRQGLIDQLLYEKYSVEDATYAVDAIGADWNVQAAKSAASYLKISSFSRQGLIDQLLYEKYTQAQAEYGVTKVGL